MDTRADTLENIESRAKDDALSYYEAADKLDHTKLEAPSVVADEMAVASHVFHAIRRGKHGDRGYHKVEALKMLHDGTAFLKFERSGDPQFRLLKLSKKDNVTLTWTQHDGEELYTLDLRRVFCLSLGQTTNVFNRAPRALALASFSLIFETDRGDQTLDLVAKDALEYAMWTEALTELIDHANKANADNSQLQELVVRVPIVHKSVPTSYLDVIRRSCKSLRKLGFFELDAAQHHPASRIEKINEGQEYRSATVEVVRIDAMGLLRDGTNYARLEKDSAKAGQLSYDENKRTLKFKTPKTSYSIPIASVSHLLCGQTTPLYDKLKIPRTLGLVSFSIMYSDPKGHPGPDGFCSWDLIAPSIDSFEIWTNAIPALAVALRNDPFKPPSELIVSVPVPQISCRVGTFLAAACKEELVIRERYFTIEKEVLKEPTEKELSDGKIKYWPRKKQKDPEFQVEANSVRGNASNTMDNSEAEHVLYTL
jgi:hypothetical protein